MLLKDSSKDAMGFHHQMAMRRKMLEALQYILVLIAAIVLASLAINYLLLPSATPVVQISNARLGRAAESFMRGYVMDKSAPVLVGTPAGTVGLASLEERPSMVTTSHILPEVPKGWGVLEFVDVPQDGPLTSASALISDLRSNLHNIDWWGVGYTQRQLQMMADAKQAYVTTRVVGGRSEVLVFLFYSDGASGN